MAAVHPVRVADRAVDANRVRLRLACPPGGVRTLPFMFPLPIITAFAFVVSVTTSPLCPGRPRIGMLRACYQEAIRGDVIAIAALKLLPGRSSAISTGKVDLGFASTRIVRMRTGDRPAWERRSFGEDHGWAPAKSVGDDHFVITVPGNASRLLIGGRFERSADGAGSMGRWQNWAALTPLFSSATASQRRPRRPQGPGSTA